MRKKTICILLILIFCLTIFSACGKVSNEKIETNEEEEYDLDRYNPKRFLIIYRGALSNKTLESELKKSFLESNSTFGLGYEENGRKVYDKSSPEYRGYIIKDREQMEEIFETFPEVDLETQMIVIVFVSITERKINLWRGFEQDGKTLKYKMKTEYQKSNGSAAPQYSQVVMGYVLDKLDVTEIEFVFYQ